MRCFLVLVFFTGFYGLGFAQEGDTIRAGRLFLDKNVYSMGINSQLAVEGLLDQSTFTPMEILLRRGAKNNQAFRVRLKGLLANTERNDDQERRKTHQSQLGLALGYEWHLPLGNRFGYYYGGEVEMGVNNNKVTRYFINSTSMGDFFVKRTDFEKTRRIGVLPLAGFTYRPSHYLYVSLEMRLEIFYEKLKFNSDSLIATIENPNNSMPGSWGRYNVANWKFNFQPYSGIFVNIIL
ncbi:hypothetical protein ADIS_3327 [Lunatimonas lonarensis]|uniref:Outer membrane protein beta-barrel domain-containing protein n=1 Tax=Lunatimonas lonarensis TaxID=1232681 RepID=R7ZQB4_9BACT|nr:hypothetical protein [Lunatimonas lonarensis]EON76199.1 hypothetical protein ADIS_3327 [Lunatimonas lonarensis]